MGSLEVPSDRYYGAQTQRSLQNFKIGNEHFQRELIRAYGILKKAAATTNESVGRLDAKISKAIISAPGYGKGFGPLNHLVSFNLKNINA